MFWLVQGLAERDAEGGLRRRVWTRVARPRARSRGMASPGITVASRFPACRQPIAGIALAALGAWLIGVGLVEPSSPDRQTGVMPAPRVVNVMNHIRSAVSERSPGGVVLSWERGPASAEQDTLMFREPVLRPRCLRADLVAEPAPPPDECGMARTYLLQAASVRWLASSLRVAEVSSETSGYGALESSRANYLGPIRAIAPALDCTISSTHQEIPSCSFLAAMPHDGPGASTPSERRVGSAIHHL